MKKGWVKKIPADALKQVMSEGDGWSILCRKYWLDAGIPEDIVNRFCRTHESDTSDTKETITNNAGQVVDSMEGIYCLHFMEAVAEDLGVNYYQASGRGSRYRNIVEAVRKCL